PFRALVNRRGRRSLDRDVVQADPVPVVGLSAVGLGLPQSDGAAGAGEVPDRLAALALHLADAVEPERREQVSVERQAALDRGDDEIDVVDARGAHLSTAPGFPRRGGSSCTVGTAQWF